MMTREEVIAEAQSWVHVPFRKKGRSRTGVDCLGVGVMVARPFGVYIVDEQNYSDWPNKNRLILEKLGRFLKPVPPITDLPGLIGVFAEARLPGHIGIFTWKEGRVHLVHARTAPPRAVVEEDWSMVPRSEMHLIGLFAFPQLELTPWRAHSSAA